MSDNEDSLVTSVHEEKRSLEKTWVTTRETKDLSSSYQLLGNYTDLVDIPFQLVKTRDSSLLSLIKEKGLLIDRMDEWINFLSHCRRRSLFAWFPGPLSFSSCVCSQSTLSMMMKGCRAYTREKNMTKDAAKTREKKVDDRQTLLTCIEHIIKDHLPFVWTDTQKSWDESPNILWILRETST